MSREGGNANIGEIWYVIKYLFKYIGCPRRNEGNAVLKNTLITYPGKGVPCDIKYRGKLYKDFDAFISDFYNDIDEDVSDE